MKGVPYSGLTAAVPPFVDAISKHDNVFWYNIRELEHQIKNCTAVCHATNHFRYISELPSPFNNPDLVVFENVYHFGFITLSKQLVNNKIPYIVVPHSALCRNAQTNKRLKKLIGNCLFFNHFIKHASAIHYLTTREHFDSGDKWNKNCFVIPNGIKIPDISNNWTEHSLFVGSFIGRLDVFQKGIDLLLKAIALTKSLLMQNYFQINIYGADSVGDKLKICEMIKKNQLEDLVSIHDPVYDDEKQQVLLHSDFFVLTSRFEGHPMGLIEALAYGLPALVTDGTNMGEEISSHNAGWTCKCTAEDISAGLKRIVADQKSLHEKQINARKLAEEYSWDRIGQSAHKIYQKIISGERVCE